MYMYMYIGSRSGKCLRCMNILINSIKGEGKRGKTYDLKYTHWYILILLKEFERRSVEGE